MANIVKRTPGGQVAPRAERDFPRTVWDLLAWDPFRMLEPAFRRADEEALFVPRFDVKETKDAYVFKADLPGVREEDVEVSMSGNRLTVTGKRESESREGDETYYTSERSYGAFSRSFTLPDGVDGEKIRAEMKDGVLAVTVPKKAEMQAKKIPISATKTAGS
jgi:HSP20 family protein